MQVLAELLFVAPLLLGGDISIMPRATAKMGGTDLAKVFGFAPTAAAVLHPPEGTPGIRVTAFDERPQGCTPPHFD